MKKSTKVFVSLIVVLAIICGAILAGTVFMALHDIFTPVNPPQITYGEFPFYVEYEMGGERHIIEDTIICEFSGIVHSLGISKVRTWDMSLKSGNEIRYIFFSEENTPSVLKPKRMNVETELWLDYGSPAYYMGDSTGTGASFEYRETWKISEMATNTEDTRLNQKELEKYFGIKIIRFEFSEPIRNEFK